MDVGYGPRIRCRLQGDLPPHPRPVAPCGGEGRIVCFQLAVSSGGRIAANGTGRHMAGSAVESASVLTVDQAQK